MFSLYIDVAVCISRLLSWWCAAVMSISKGIQTSSECWPSSCGPAQLTCMHHIRIWLLTGSAWLWCLVHHLWYYWLEQFTWLLPFIFAKTNIFSAGCCHNISQASSLQASYCCDIQVLHPRAAIVMIGMHKDMMVSCHLLAAPDCLCRGSSTRVITVHAAHEL